MKLFNFSILHFKACFLSYSNSFVVVNREALEACRTGGMTEQFFFFNCIQLLKTHTCVGGFPHGQVVQKQSVSLPTSNNLFSLLVILCFMPVLLQWLSWLRSKRFLLFGLFVKQ